MVFHTNPCNFCKFSSCHKIFAFRCKGLEISILLNVVPLFLSPIVICQQLLLVFGGQSFLASIQNLLIFAIFKSSLNLNPIRHWSKNWCPGYLEHALCSSEIHLAAAKSLEIIGHVTNCCKRPMVHHLLLMDFINLGIHASFKALNIIFISVMRIPPLSGS